MRLLILRMADKYRQKDPFWGFLIFLFVVAAILIVLILQGVF